MAEKATKKDAKEEKGTQLDMGLARRIIQYLAPYKVWVGIAFFLTMGAAWLGPLRPKLIQLAIDNHIITGDLEGLKSIMWLLVFVLLGEAVLSFANGYLTQWVGQKAILDLRTSVFRHLQRLPLSFYDKSPIGRLITRVTSDVEALNTLLSAGVVNILGQLFRLGFIAYYMFTLNVTLAILALAVLPLMIWATFLFRKKVRIAYRETRKQVARLNSFIQEHVTGMQIVQAFNREAEELKRFESVNDDHRKVQVKTILYYALFWPAVDLVASLALGLIIWYGGVESMGGTLTLGILVAFIQYVRQFFEPIRNLSDQYNTLQSAMAASERIFDILDNDSAIPDGTAVVADDKLIGEIEFKNVWFAYDKLTDEEVAAGKEPNWILKDISFKVSAGETIALVGATGSGKTTILNILLRLYPHMKGEVLIDGIQVESLSLQQLRRHIGLVLQDVFLFSGSVKRNITLGDETITDEQVESAAKSVGVHKFIDRLPLKYEQDVKERGAALSYGQRQLLSFVRALVYDPTVLVLDEATSSIDSETEGLIQDALDKLMDNRTSIVVAHRLSTIQHADQILVMHKGKIRERGDHADLLSQNGLYRRLYELQYQEQE